MNAGLRSRVAQAQELAFECEGSDDQSTRLLGKWAKAYAEDVENLLTEPERAA